eukprot:6400604-Alexandrium_andersonii.AAC.1
MPGCRPASPGKAPSLEPALRAGARKRELPGCRLRYAPAPIAQNFRRASTHEETPAPTTTHRERAASHAGRRFFGPRPTFRPQVRRYCGGGGGARGRRNDQETSRALHAT